MKYRLLFLLAVFSLSTYSQAWSTFLNPSRAIDWTSAGFKIPNYTTSCATQPTLTANTSSAAAANATAIQNALASCDASHNVVNIPAGTYYVAGFTYGSQGHQVLRGAGPNATTLIPTSDTGCNGFTVGICMGADTGIYWQNSAVLSGGSHQCAWTAGYAQGTTSITLSSCGGTPPSNTVLFLDQTNDTSDTNGIYICDSYTTGCAIESSTNANGRLISGVGHSQIQSVWLSNVTSLGGGSYSATISPGVYFNNIRSGQTPGAWWPGFVQNLGMENLTIDHSYSTSNNANVAIWNCYQCWVKNTRQLKGGRNHIAVYESLQTTVRDNYFYQAQTPGTSQSYGIEIDHGTSALLVENNIFQQLTIPVMFGQGSGNVIGYNYSIDNQQSDTNIQVSYYAHNAGNNMNLWEGNNFDGINADSSTFGGSTNGTIFRNMLIGWQLGKNQYTYPLSLESWSRAFNVVGNVFGQPGYHVTYESYATSTTGGVNGGDAVNTSIYALGWTGNGGWGSCGGPPVCGPLVRTTLMRWGNWDVATNGAKWNSTEASPAAVPYVNANFTSTYFDSLAHTLPASLYYTSTPSWWPSGKAWPPIGPDVTSGNLGTCTGTYPGVQAVSSSQCTSGTLNLAWAGHANSLPAQDCFLNVMYGVVDGTGSGLPFDASQCYASTQPTGPARPPQLTAAVQ